MKKFATCVGLTLCLLGTTALAQEYEGEGYGTSTQSRDMFYLSFSIGDGGYVVYSCDYEYGCDEFIMGPADFEILGGVKITPNLYLDVALNWSIDYNSYYYDSLTYMFGVSPGIRFVFPRIFNRHLYLRGAIPIQKTIETGDDVWFVGALLGIGLEWVWQNMGLFVEADIEPYFREVYPGHYVIPAKGRVGVSIRF